MYTNEHGKCWNDIGSHMVRSYSKQLFSLDALQLLGLALSADRLAAAAVSAPLEALPQAVFSFSHPPTLFIIP